jgi:flagellar biosynthetic protein FliO
MKAINHKYIRILLILSSCIFMVLQPAMAAFGQQDASPMQQNQMDLRKAVVRTMLSLGIVIILLFGFIWGVKWLQTKARTTYQTTRALKVMESLPLGPKKSIHLVKAADRVFVLGAADGQISMLLELKKDEIAKLQENNTKKARSFSKALAAQLSNLSGAKTV